MSRKNQLQEPTSLTTGSESQNEWAERIKKNLAAEFNRMVKAFETVSNQQDDAGKADTQAIIAIVEELRSTVLSNKDAGYYIRVWQDIQDQLRHMVLRDPRYQAIRANRSIRKSKKA